MKNASANIIVASANEGFRSRIVDLLRSSHWSAEEALGGAEALARVEEGRCQLLLLDSWLPDLDVTEVSGIVKKRYPEIGVSVLDADTGAPLGLEAWCSRAKSPGDETRSAAWRAILDTGGLPPGCSGQYP